jgi:Ca2+-binding RTX toxin-like protein
MNVTLASHSQTIASLRGTSAQTRLVFGDGDDDVYIASGANISSIDSANFVPGVLQAFDAPLFIDLAAGSHKLVLSDEESALGQVGTLTEHGLVGISPAPITYVIAAEADGGDMAGGVALWLGQGDDTLEVNGTLWRNATRTLTAVHAGAGADVVVVRTQVGLDDLCFVALGTGNDTGNTEGTLPALMTGGGGSDRLTGSLRQSLLCGDECLLTFGGANASVTSRSTLGGGPNRTVIDRAGRHSLLARLETIPVLVEASFATAVSQHAGLLQLASGTGDDRMVAFNDGGVLIGGGKHDHIAVGDGPFVVFGDDAAVDFEVGADEDVASKGGDPLPLQAYAPRLVTTLFASDAGNDNITTGNHPVIVFGGFGGDTVTTGDGPDLVYGDNGIAAVSAHSCSLALGICLHPLVLEVRWAHSLNHEEVFEGHNETRGGGCDTLYLGEGDNVAVAGGGADRVESGAGDDQLALDQADFVPARGYPALVSSLQGAACAACGGNDEARPGNGSDFVLGGQGDDVIESEQGDNTFIGGHSRPGGHDGADTLVDGDGEGVLIGDNGAVEYLNLAAGHAIPFPRAWRVTQAAAASSPQTRARLVTLFDGYDGQGQGDMIQAGAGSDLIYGQTGGDMIDMGCGSDAASGGLGNNTILGDADGRDMVCAASCRFVWRQLAEGTSTPTSVMQMQGQHAYPYVVVQQTVVSAMATGNLSALAAAQGSIGPGADDVVRVADLVMLGSSVPHTMPADVAALTCPAGPYRDPLPPTPAPVLTDEWLSEAERDMLLAEANVTDPRLNVAHSSVFNGASEVTIAPTQAPPSGQQPLEDAVAEITLTIIDDGVLTAPDDILALRDVAVESENGTRISLPTTAALTLNVTVRRTSSGTVTGPFAVNAADVVALMILPPSAGVVSYDGTHVYVQLSANATAGLVHVAATVSTFNTTTVVEAQLCIVRSSLALRLRPFPVGDIAVPDIERLQVLGKAPYAEAAVILPELHLSTGGRIGSGRLPSIETRLFETANVSARVHATFVAAEPCMAPYHALCLWAEDVTGLARTAAGTVDTFDVWRAAVLPWASTKSIRSLQPGINEAALNETLAAATARRASVCAGPALARAPLFFNASAVTLNASATLEAKGNCLICANGTCMTLTATAVTVEASVRLDSAFNVSETTSAISHRVVLSTDPIAVTGVALFLPPNVTAPRGTRRMCVVEAIFANRSRSRWPSLLANTPPLEALFSLTSSVPSVLATTHNAVVVAGQASRVVSVELAPRLDVAVSTPSPRASVLVAVNLSPLREEAAVSSAGDFELGQLEGLPLPPVRSGVVFAVPLWLRNSSAQANVELSLRFDAAVLEILTVRSCSGAAALRVQHALGVAFLDLVPIEMNAAAGRDEWFPLVVAVFRARWLGEEAPTEVEAKIWLETRSGGMSPATNISVLVDMASPAPAWTGEHQPDDEAAAASLRDLRSVVALLKIAHDGANMVDLSQTRELNSTLHHGALLLGGGGDDVLYGTPAGDIIAGSGAYGTGAGGSLPAVRHEYVFQRCQDSVLAGEAIRSLVREQFTGAVAFGAPPLAPLALRNQSDISLPAVRPWLVAQSAMSLGQTRLRLGSGQDMAGDEEVDLHVVLPPTVVRQRGPASGNIVMSGGGDDIIAGDMLLSADALLPLPEAIDAVAARVHTRLAEVGRRLQGLSTDAELLALLKSEAVPDFVIKVRGLGIGIEKG